METSVLLTIPLKEFISCIEETVRKVLSETNVNQDKLLTSEEVMSLLSISTTTLQTWRDKNKIPFQRIGNKIFYSKSEIMNMLKPCSATTVEGI